MRLGQFQGGYTQVTALSEYSCPRCQVKGTLREYKPLAVYENLIIPALDPFIRCAQCHSIFSCITWQRDQNGSNQVESYELLNKTPELESWYAELPAFFD